MTLVQELVVKEQEKKLFKRGEEKIYNNQGEKQKEKDKVFQTQPLSPTIEKVVSEKNIYSVTLPLKEVPLLEIVIQPPNPT